MKKLSLIILFVGLLLLFSCEKKYTCWDCITYEEEVAIAHIVVCDVQEDEIGMYEIALETQTIWLTNKIVEVKCKIKE